MTIDIHGLKHTLDADSLVVSSLSTMTRLNWMVGNHMYRVQLTNAQAREITQEDLVLKMQEAVR